MKTLSFHTKSVYLSLPSFVNWFHSIFDIFHTFQFLYFVMMIRKVVNGSDNTFIISEITSVIRDIFVNLDEFLILFYDLLCYERKIILSVSTMHWK